LIRTTEVQQERQHDKVNQLAVTHTRTQRNETKLNCKIKADITVQQPTAYIRKYNASCLFIAYSSTMHCAHLNIVPLTSADNLETIQMILSPE
jgi:hypothetical protein